MLPDVIKQRSRYEPLLKRALQLFAVCVFLTSCALQPKVEQSFEQRLEQLQAEHRFGAAQRSIQRESEETLGGEEKQKLLTANEAKAAAYEQSVIDVAAKQQQQEDWNKAGKEFEHALLVFPESAALIAANNQYLEARDEYLRQKLLEHRVMRAKRIPDELRSLNAIIGAGGSAEFDAAKAQIELESELTAEALLAQGQKLLAQKKWRQARDTLQLSQSVREDERTETAIRVAASNIKPRRAKRPKKPKVVPVPTEVADETKATEVAAAMHRYRYELQRKDFANARAQIERARELKPDDDAVLKEYKQFQSLLQSNAQQYIEQGKYHYSLGDIDSAITQWEAAYVLTPGDDALKERLQKARRFKARYEQLKR